MFDPNGWIPTFAETLYIMASLLMIFFIFGFSVYVKARLDADKTYFLKKKVGRILNKAGLTDLEVSFRGENLE